MNFRFGSEALRRMYVEPGFTGGFAQPIVRAFRKVMWVIRDAVDERNLYLLPSLRFKKLEGSRSHQRSLRLNDQWRLIVEIEESTPKNTVVVVNIEDYH